MKKIGIDSVMVMLLMGDLKIYRWFVGIVGAIGLLMGPGTQRE